eukprot:1815587-Amphidinium_carterae.1
MNLECEASKWSGIRFDKNCEINAFRFRVELNSWKNSTAKSSTCLAFSALETLLKHKHLSWGIKPKPDRHLPEEQSTK